MLAKIQILFFLLYIFFLIFKITSSKKIILSNSNFINYYFYFSLFIGILGYSYFQLHIQDFPRFSLNNFIDLIFFSSLFFLFFVTSFFVKKVKENILLQSEDNKFFTKKDFKIVSNKKPTSSQFED